MPRLPRQQPRRPRRLAFTQARHQSQPSAISATPAKQSDDPCQLCVSKLCVSKLCVCKSCVCVCVQVVCEQVVCEQVVCEQVVSVSKLCVSKLYVCKVYVSKLCVSKCHACQTKLRSMSQSARPTTQSDGRCHKVPRLPRQQPRRPRRLAFTQARHQIQPSAISATPATQSDDPCQLCVSKLYVSKLCVCVCKSCV